MNIMPFGVMHHNNTDQYCQPDLPGCFSNYNYHCTESVNPPHLLRDFQNIYNFIEGFNQASTKKAGIYRVVKSQHGYQIACDIKYSTFSYFMDGTCHFYDSGTLHAHEEHPAIALFKDIRCRHLSDFYLNLNFNVDYGLTPKYLRSYFMDQKTCEQICQSLNRVVSSIVYESNLLEFKKACLQYGSDAKEKLQTVKKYVTKIHRENPRSYMTEQYLFFTPEQNNKMLAKDAIDYMEQLIDCFQYYPSCNAIKGYIWRLDYSYQYGYFYVFNCFFVQDEVSAEITNQFAGMWRYVIGQAGQTDGHVGNGRKNNFPQMFNSLGFLDKFNQKEFIKYILAPIEMGQYLRLRTGDYKKATFGYKDLTSTLEKASKALPQQSDSETKSQKVAVK